MGLSAALRDRFGGEVPRRMKDLVTLPGVGRKTANVVLGNAFGVPGITVDTHFGRLARRFGWTDATEPDKVEADVGSLFPRSQWTILSHRLIWHGRRVCHARRPACGACALARSAPLSAWVPSIRRSQPSWSRPGRSRDAAAQARGAPVAAGARRGDSQDAGAAAAAAARRSGQASAILVLFGSRPPPAPMTATRICCSSSAGPGCAGTAGSPPSPAARSSPGTPGRSRPP